MSPSTVGIMLVTCLRKTGSGYSRQLSRYQGDLLSATKEESVRGLRNVENRCDGQLGTVYSSRVTQGSYLSIIGLTSAEERFHGIVTGNDESRNIDEEFASNIEEDKKEVDADQSEESIDFWNRGLLLEVVEHRILRKLRFKDQHCMWSNANTLLGC